MDQDDPFVDHYDILQVDPNCDSRALEVAYRYLAKMYHPDHADTADVTKLAEVIRAYRVLKDAEKRAKYDIFYARSTGFIFSTNDEVINDEKSAVSDADSHEKILLILYKRRRGSAQDAGVGQYFIQEILKCSDEIFEFHIWYLKEKGYIKTTEQGTLAITIDGVDRVISMSRTAMKERGLLTQFRDGHGQAEF